MEAIDRALREQFGFASFRPNQREIIEHVLARRHTLAVLPTGLGKSLCYQLPAQLLSGLTLVVSPLIALMQDQVEALLHRGFKNVTYLNSALSPAEVGRRFTEIERGACKLVYLAPERGDSPRFQQLIRQAEIALVVIDEAHCISQWGHDFRPHFRTMLTRFPELRRSTFLALTATATPEVQRDIIAALALPALERVIADFNRPNLHFETIRLDEREEKDARLIELLSDNDGAAIVYASTRKEAAAVQQLLEAHGFAAALYHAGLTAGQRAEAQRRFLGGDCRIIAATVAFGLGIDKPDVRRVIHYNIPGSLENYYQEAGRAGRDGEPAICTLFYSQADVRIQRFLLEQAYPDPRTIQQVYGLLRDAHPLPVAVGDLARAGGKPEIAVNAALQLLSEERWARITTEGKYQVEKPELPHPRIEARTIYERRRRAEGRLRKMISYALDEQCRRGQILGYFGQKFPPPCAACDVCAPGTNAQPASSRIAESPEQTPAAVPSEVSNRVARIILQSVAEFGGRLGRTTLAEVLAGSKSKRMVELKLDRSGHYGALRLHTRERVLGWIDELIGLRLLKTTPEEYPRLLITEPGAEALKREALLALSGLAQASARPEAEPGSDSDRERAMAQPLPDPRHDWRMQVEIWRQGGAEPDRRVLLKLLRELRAGDREQLIALIMALKDLKVGEAGADLLALLGETTNGNLINAVCDALGQLGTEEATPALIGLLEDERQGVRRIAARALGRLRARPALASLERLAVEDAAENVRIAAAAAAIRIKDS